MKLFWNRLYIMLKRTLMQPLYIGMLVVLIGMSIIYINIPAKNKTMYVPAAICNHDNSNNGKEFEKAIYNSNSIYHFYAVDSDEQVKKDVLSGKANIGFIIPEGFFASSAHIGSIKQIIEYTTNSSRLPNVGHEIFFSKLFKMISYEIVLEELDTNLVSTLQNMTDQGASPEEILEQVKDELSEVYFESSDDSGVYESQFADSDSYDDNMVEKNKTELPIRKFSALFIFVVALLGTSAYLSDKEKNIYLLADHRARFQLRITHILASILPISLAAYIALVIIREMNPGTLLLRMLAYMLYVSLFSVLLGAVLRKSSYFYRVLPVILVLTLVFSGVFFDIGKYNAFLKHFSMIFPPYFF